MVGLLRDSQIPGISRMTRLSARSCLLGPVIWLIWVGAALGGEPDRMQSFRVQSPESAQGLSLDLGTQDVVEDDAAADPSAGELERPGTPRVNWSRGLRDDWQLNTVILNRRQAGEPARVDDDLRLETFGFELRRPF